MTPQEQGRDSDALSRTIARNITALMAHERATQRQARLEDRIADKVTRFAGSMLFVVLHLVLFGTWIAVNLGLVPGLPRFDPTLVILAMVASVEAIFISTFVLISQNRMVAAADRQAKLNLQISLLAEHETTRLMALVAAIADRLQVVTPLDDEIRDLQRDVTPEAVLDRIDEETSGRKSDG